MRLRIAEKWQQFRLKVIPSHAPRIQIVEMRRAFYSGVKAQMEIQDELIGDDSLDDPKEDEMAVEALEEEQGELDQFFKDVQEGRA